MDIRRAFCLSLMITGLFGFCGCTTAPGKQQYAVPERKQGTLQAVQQPAGPPAKEPQVVDIVFTADDGKLRAEGKLLLSVFFTFSGREGQPVEPDASTELTGPSGITTQSKIAKPYDISIPFSSVFKIPDSPQRLYFGLGKGSLTLYWSDSALTNKQTAFSVPLSHGWLSHSCKIPPSAEHPLGGLQIDVPDASNLTFYIQFKAQRSFGSPVEAMGTAPDEDKATTTKTKAKKKSHD